MDEFDLITTLMIAVSALAALTIHEFSHGLIAYSLGDDTAKKYGRLTLNPIKHIDLMGLLAMILIRIGWAKPVPINPLNFKNRKLGILLTSLAGPFSNILLAVIFAFIFNGTLNLNSYYLSIFLLIFVQINVGFAVFNILPLPPLDGSKILAALLPVKWETIFYRYERYLAAVILVLYVTGVISSFIIPIINAIIDFLLI